MQTNTRQPRAAVIDAFQYQESQEMQALLDWQNNPPPGWYFEPVQRACAAYFEPVTRQPAPPPPAPEYLWTVRQLLVVLSAVCLFWSAVVIGVRSLLP